MKRDIADEETEKVLKEIENEISKEYAQAEKEIAKKLDDYLEKFRVKDELKRKAVANGLISEQKYKDWRIGQIMIGQRWTEMRNALAQDLTNADKIARSIAFEHMPYVYAINHDYSTFLIEKASLLDTSYTLYDRHAMEQLVKDTDTFIPAPGRKVKRDIKEGKALAWNNKLVQSAMMQSLLQGEAIPDIATRLAKTVGESDRKAAIRNARTLTTGIENAGRVASYRRANDMGIETRKQWLATLDDRTRHWHASLDGETVDYDQPFKNKYGKIMYPGDPAADPGNIFNCRCTLIPSIKGFERDLSDKCQRDDRLGDMSYEDWKAGHYEERSDDILKQDQIAETMKAKYGAEYAEYSNLAGVNNDENDLNMAKKGDIIPLEAINISMSETINGFTTTEEIKNHFKHIAFSDSFGEMQFESQKAVAQALEYMNNEFGHDAMPLSLIAVSSLGANVAKSSPELLRIRIETETDPGLAFVAICHESIHLFDKSKKDIAKSVMNEAYKRLGLRKINDKQSALKRSLGYELFLAYSNNETEQLAWCYEKTLYGKGSELGNEVRSIMKERYGAK